MKKAMGKEVKAGKAGKATREVRFELAAQPGSKVFVAGSFNNWDPAANPLEKSMDGGSYQAAFRLPPGRHEYKFVVNGLWTIDTGNADWRLNRFGTLNSVLRV